MPTIPAADDERSDNTKRAVGKCILCLLLLGSVVWCIRYISDDRAENTPRREDAPSNGYVADKPWREDASPIIRRFPYFDGLYEKTIWKAGRLDEDSLFDGLGPSIYWMKGYIFCEQDVMDIEHDRNDWERVDVVIEQPFLLPGSTFPDDAWVLSPSLNQMLLKDEFKGHFYYYPKEKIMFFDVKWGG